MAYFDNNSTTRPFPEVLDAVRSASDSSWANPSSPHRAGSQVRVRLEQAREEFGHSLGVDPARLTFTSGATESNNAVLGWLANRKSLSGGTAFVSTIEHPSVLETARHLFTNRIELIPANHDGLVELGKVEELFKQKRPTLVSLLAAHNETGVLQPWKEVAQLCQEYGVWFHCDATQWMGKLDPHGFDLCSSFSFSAHKFGGPKGVGGMFSHEPISWIRGGGQEKEQRGGTENFPAIEGMRIAWRQTCKKLPLKEDTVAWKEKFESQIKQDLPGVRIIGEKVSRLWNTSFLMLPDFNNSSWVYKLDKLGYSLSTGSACSTARKEASELAGAIGLSYEDGGRLLRVSSWFNTSEEEWTNLACALVQAHAELVEDRDQSGVITL
jgi:cysteine desulfurase